VFGSYLRKGEVAALIGTSGMGKSLLLTAILVSVASGVPLAGEGPTEPHPAVIVCAEESMVEMKLRIEAAAEAAGADRRLVDQNLHVLDAEGHFSIAQKTGVDRRAVTRQAHRFFRLNRQIGAKLVGLDPLIELHDLNENDNGDMHFLAAALRNVAREAEASVIVTHHIGKLDGGKVTIGSARGASSLVGAVRAARSLADLSAGDHNLLGIDAAEAADYFKVEDLKMSYAPRRKEPTYFQRVSVDIRGMQVPKLVVPIPRRR
jgi:RecA-family ATPase